MLNFLKRLLSKITGRITVVIPAQTWNAGIYNDGRSCYLAKALTNAGYINVVVNSWGFTKINGNSYRTTKKFDQIIVKEALCEGKSIKVTLKRY